MSTNTSSLSSEQFLGYFPQAWIQYFHDSAKEQSMAHSTERLDLAEAQRKQSEGCGVFFTPNACEGGRKAENLVHIQALYIDLDVAKENENLSPIVVDDRKAKAYSRLLDFPLRPQVITETKNGLHAIWRLEPIGGVEAQALFDEAESILIQYFDADKGVKDVTRVLRLPGFKHLKNPSQPFECRIIHNELNRKLYTLEEAVDMLRKVEPPQKPEPPLASTTTKVTGVVIPVGGRNTAAASEAGRLLATILQDEWETKAWPQLQVWNSQRCIPPLSEKELCSIFENIAKKEQRKKKNDSAESPPVAYSLDEFDFDSRSILPIQAFDGKTAYVAVPLQNKSGGIDMFTITSSREHFPCTAEEFRRRGFTMKRSPLLDPQLRWPQKPLVSFLRGATAPSLAEVYQQIVAQLRRYVDFADPRDFETVAGTPYTGHALV